MAQAELGLVFKFDPSYTKDDRYRVVVGIDETTKPPTFLVGGFTAPDGSQPFDISQARLSYMVGGGHLDRDIGPTFGTITLQEAQDAMGRFIDTEASNLKPHETILKQDLADGWIRRR